MGRVLPLWSRPPGPQISLSIVSVPRFPLSPTNRLFLISCFEPSSWGKVPPLWGKGWRWRGCSHHPTSHAPGCSTSCTTLTLPRSGQCHCQQICKEKRDASEEVWVWFGLSCQTKIAKAMRWRTAGLNYWALLMGELRLFQVCSLVVEDLFWHNLQYTQIT